MTTITQIEQELITDSQDGDLTAMKAVVDSITAAQLPELSKTDLGTALNNLAFDAQNSGTNTAAVNTEIQDFSTHLGASTDATALSSALVRLSGIDDYTGMASIIDNVSAAQKPLINGPNQWLDTVINNLAWDAQRSGTNTAAANTEIQDFSTHLGASTDATALGEALVTLSQFDDYTGMASIIDNVSAAQKPLINGPNQWLDQVIQELANDAQFGTNMAAANTEIQDFSTHLGASTDAAALGQALATLSQFDDYTGMASIIDNVTTVQKPLINGPNQTLDQAINNLAQDATFSSPNTAAANTEIQDFSTHLGASTDATALGQALATLSQFDDYTGMASIIDNVSAAQKPLINGPTQWLDQVIQELANDAQFGTNMAAANTEIQDFSTHLGASTDAAALGQALATLSQFDDYTGMASIIDNVTTVQKPLVNGPNQTLDQAINNLAQDATFSSPNTAAANTEIQDFSTHLGASTDATALGEALVTLSQFDDYTGMASIIDNVSTAQKPLINGPTQWLDQVIQELANDAQFGTNMAAANTEIQDFSTHLGASTDAAALGQALATLSQFDDYTGMASIIDNVTTVQKPLVNGPNQTLDQAINNLAQDATFSSPNTAAVNTEIQDFSTHLGASTDATALGQALATLSQFDDYTGMASIIDNVSAAQKPLINGPTQWLDQVIQELANDAQFGTNTAAANTEIQDFSTHLGSSTDAAALGSALVTLSHANDFTAMASIFDHLTDTQWSSLSGLPTTTGSGLGLITGTTGSDVIHANSNTHGDVIFGGSGNDTLIGGAGHDVLDGGTGTNTLTGGTGADTYLFDNLGNSSNTVTNFSTTKGDVIDLADVLHFNSAVSIANFVELTTSGSNTIVSVSENGTGSGWVAIAQLDHVTGLNVQTLYNDHQLIL